MIHIDFDPAKLKGVQKTWWTAWEAQAKQATVDLLKAWEASQKNNDTTYKAIFEHPQKKQIWSDLKNWLLTNVFNEKCAYCETPMLRATLHAEHYRPKGRVTQNGKKATVKDDQGKDVVHPGYFWLAFHWTNLLPACEWCNTVNGKRNEFPIPKTTYLSVLKKLTATEVNCLQVKLIQSSSWPDIFYFQREDLDDKEGRLLLHPYFDQPSKSLMFDDFGEVVAYGTGHEKLCGEQSIKAYNLNDGRIAKARREALDVTLDRFDTLAKTYKFEGLSLDAAKIKARAHSIIQEYVTRKAPYSAAVLDYLHRAHKDYF